MHPAGYVEPIGPYRVPDWGMDAAFSFYWWLGSLMDGPGAVLGFAAGLPVAPHFDAPYLSASISEFWSTRWNLTVSNALRFVAYDPINEGAASLSLGSCIGNAASLNRKSTVSRGAFGSKGLFKSPNRDSFWLPQLAAQKEEQAFSGDFPDSEFPIGRLGATGASWCRLSDRLEGGCHPVQQSTQPDGGAHCFHHQRHYARSLPMVSPLLTSDRPCCSEISIVQAELYSSDCLA